MTTQTDAIAGLIEKLTPRTGEYGCRFVSTVTLLEAATQLDSLLKERDALQARVKDQQEGMETLAKEHLELARDFDKLSEMSKASETLRKNALSVAEQWQDRALRAEQELKELAEAHTLLTDPVAVHMNMLRGGIAKPSWLNIQHLYPEEFSRLQHERDEAYARLKPFAKVAVTHPVTLQQMGITTSEREAARDLVRRLSAGPEKEKKE